ncbi:MAG: hypothetical protein SNI45_06925 [Rikenellaceae bacterium]
MKRKGYISQKIETLENFEDAFQGYSENKRNRKVVRDFEKNLESNLQNLLQRYKDASWTTSEYVYKEVYHPKKRIVAKLPVDDHVIQWAACLQIEELLHDSMIGRSCSCVKGKGTHYFSKILQDELLSDPEDTFYFVQLDIHHYFLNINQDLLKERYRRKFKDPKLLSFLDEFVDSFDPGLPLGVKISQILANVFLAPFDWLALECFNILGDREKFKYWQSRYVTDKLIVCRNEFDAVDVGKGVHHLNMLFERYVREGLRHYFRFADNIIILHRDKTFLHIITEMSIMILTRDYPLEVNRNWNVRPVHAGGIDVCGYIYYHDHTMLRKRNKKALCRQVAKLRNKGTPQREIELKCASRVGFASHCNSKHLLKTLDMEKRLGAKIKNKRKKAPFEGMEFDQKQSIDDIICHLNDEENDKLIQLIDYKVDDSVIEKNDDGTPKQRIALRYKTIKSVSGSEDEPIYEWNDTEHYTFSGSKIMIEQAQEDFSKEDLPSPTVIKEFINKLKKKFYKFT